MLVGSAREMGACVRSLRRAAGLSQEGLSARAGVGRQWLIDLERGKRTVELELVLRTLRELGAELSVETVPRRDPYPTASQPAYENLDIGDPNEALERASSVPGALR